MKRITFILTIILTLLILSACEKKTPNLKVVYQITSLQEMNLNDIETELSKSNSAVYIQINLKDDYDSDEIKKKVMEVDPNEIDSLIRNSRQKAQKYYQELNKNFIVKYNLSFYGNNLYSAKYSPTITIFFDEKDELLAQLKTLVQKIDFNDISNIELLIE